MMNQDDLYTEDISRSRKLFNLSICMYINSFLSSFTVFYALLGALETLDFIDWEKIPFSHGYYDIKFWESDLMFIPVVFNLFWIIAGPWCDLIIKLIPNKPRLISICANLLFIGGILSSLLLIHETKIERKQTQANHFDFTNNILDNFTASRILPGFLSGFGACLLRKQSLFVLQKYYNDNFHSVEIYLKSSFYLGSAMISIFLIALVNIDYMALVIIYFLIASFNCFILLFYKNPNYGKAMVSRYEILDNDAEDLDVYVKVQEIEKNFRRKLSENGSLKIEQNHNNVEVNEKENVQETTSSPSKPIYYKKIGESSKQVYGDTSYSQDSAAAQNQIKTKDENVYVIENESSANNPGDQIIYEYGKTTSANSDREKYITETANRLNNQDLNKKVASKSEKLKIVDNTARSRLMASFSKDGNTTERKESVAETEPQPIYSETQLQIDSRQNKTKNENCCSKFCEEFVIFKKPPFYPSLILYLYQRLMPLFFWVLLPLVLLRAGVSILFCLSIYLGASFIGMAGNTLILKLSKMSANMRVVYLSVFCMLASMALYELTMIYRASTLAVITMVASFCLSASTSLSRLIIHDYLEIQDLNKARIILSTIYALSLLFSTLGYNNSTDAYFKLASFVNLSIGTIYGSFVMLRVWIRFNKP